MENYFKAKFNSHLGEFELILTKANCIWLTCLNNSNDNEQLNTYLTLTKLFWSKSLKHLTNLELVDTHLIPEELNLNELPNKLSYYFNELDIGQITITTNHDNYFKISNYFDYCFNQIPLALENGNSYLYTGKLLNNNYSLISDGKLISNIRLHFSLLKIVIIADTQIFSCYFTKNLYFSILQLALSLNLDQFNEPNYYSQFYFNFFSQLALKELYLINPTWLIKDVSWCNYITKPSLIFKFKVENKNLGLFFIDNWQNLRPNSETSNNSSKIINQPKIFMPLILGEAFLTLDEVKDLTVGDVIMLNTQVSDLNQAKLLFGDCKLPIEIDYATNKISII